LKKGGGKTFAQHGVSAAPEYRLGLRHILPSLRYGKTSLTPGTLYAMATKLWPAFLAGSLRNKNIFLLDL